MLGVRIPPGLLLFFDLYGTDMLNKINSFFDDVWQEMQKVSWPTFPELRGSTVVVIVVSLMFALFIFVVDRGLTTIMRYILQ